MSDQTGNHGMMTQNPVNQSPAEKKLPLLAVVGPTASGKSELAVRLAAALGGEIVGCDSMQIYRDMEIGTAKPTAEERAAVRHHLIDFVDPADPRGYSCADYAADAVRAVAGIHARGRLPIVCGGTGLYLDALLFDRPWSESEGKSGIRERLTREAEELGPHGMWLRLAAVDPESAAKTHENNVRRVVRALEIFEQTGRTKSELDRVGGEARYDHLVIALRRQDREAQNARIAARVDRMLEGGLIAETEKLMRAGVFDTNRTAAQAIGYKEMLGYVRGESSLDAAREALIIATRQYAKRQLTWFGAKDYVTWLDVTDGRTDVFAEAMRIVTGRFEFCKTENDGQQQPNGSDPDGGNEALAGAR